MTMEQRPRTLMLIPEDGGGIHHRPGVPEDSLFTQKPNLTNTQDLQLACLQKTDIPLTR